MTHEEAQNILQLCRPDHVEDLSDPLIAEALEQMEQDSELCVWFEEQQLFDAEIYAEFNRIKPPEDLKATILKGMQEQISPPENEPSPAESATSNTVHTSDTARVSWFRPWMGIAAVFLVAAVFLALPRKQPPQQLTESGPTTDSIATVAGIPDLIEFLGKRISDFNGSKFDKRSEAVGELKSFLAVAGMPSPGEIPQKLEALPTLGCATFDYEGTQLSMICFKDDKVYHLITINKADLNSDRLPEYSSPEATFFEHRQQAFKLWSGEEQIYILCVEGTKEEIPEFI